MKLREIEEKNLCPKCGSRLFKEPMPRRLFIEWYPATAWHCFKCDKYFEEVKNTCAY